MKVIYIINYKLLWNRKPNYKLQISNFKLLQLQITWNCWSCFPIINAKYIYKSSSSTAVSIYYQTKTTSAASRNTPIPLMSTTVYTNFKHNLCRKTAITRSGGWNSFVLKMLGILSASTAATQRTCEDHSWRNDVSKPQQTRRWRRLEAVVILTNFSRFSNICTDTCNVSPRNAVYD